MQGFSAKQPLNAIKQPTQREMTAVHTLAPKAWQLSQSDSAKKGSMIRFRKLKLRLRKHARVDNTHRDTRRSGILSGTHPTSAQFLVNPSPSTDSMLRLRFRSNAKRRREPKRLRDRLKSEANTKRSIGIELVKPVSGIACGDARLCATVRHHQLPRHSEQQKHECEHAEQSRVIASVASVRRCRWCCCRRRRCGLLCPPRAAVRQHCGRLPCTPRVCGARTRA